MGDDNLEPQRHWFTSNEFYFIFCEAGCVVTNDLPDQSHPTYIEFHNNTYKDIYGIKGAILHTQLAH